MNLNELKKMAKGLGVKPSNLKKPDLIRTIQVAEGNIDCFGKAEGDCDQKDCLFIADCLR